MEVDSGNSMNSTEVALAAAGYTRLDQLAGVRAAELKQLHGMGPKALKLLQEALEERGSSLG